MTDPVRTISLDGIVSWRLNGELHRTDGPAIEWANGDKCWYLNGNRHRIDGPAVEYGYKAWYLHGERVDPIVHFLRVGELKLDKS